MANPTKQQLHYDARLQNMAVAIMQSPENYIAGLFPTVPSEKQSDKYPIFTQADFFRDEAKVRANATESEGGGWRMSDDTFYAEVYAWHKDVTSRDRANDDLQNIDEVATKYVMDTLLLKKEKLFVSDCFGTSKWGTDWTGVNAGPAANQFVRWNVAGSTPVTDITNAKLVIGRLTGKKPNLLVLSPEVEAVLKNHSDIVSRVISPGARSAVAVTNQHLADVFEVEQVIVPWVTENTAKEGQTASYSWAYGKHALLLYNNPNAGKMDATGLKFFVWSGKEGADARTGLSMARIAMDQLGVGTERIEGELGIDVKVVSAPCGLFLNGAIA